jgi:molybdopterin converting factor small subunit
LKGRSHPYPLSGPLQSEEQRAPRERVTGVKRGIMVTVRLLGNLSSASGERVLEWNVKEPTPLRQLLDEHQKEIPEVLSLLSQKEPECMLTVGIRIAMNTTIVKDGDIIKVTPHNSQLHAADFPTWHGGTI